MENVLILKAQLENKYCNMLFCSTDGICNFKHIFIVGCVKPQKSSWRIKVLFLELFNTLFSYF